MLGTGRFMRVFGMEFYHILQAFSNQALAIQQFFDRNKTAPLKRSSLSLKIFSPLLLYAPDYMFRELDRIIIDKRVNDNDWVSFVDECRSQWSAIVLNVSCIDNPSVSTANREGDVTGYSVLNSEFSILSYSFS